MKNKTFVLKILLLTLPLLFGCATQPRGSAPKHAASNISDGDEPTPENQQSPEQEAEEVVKPSVPVAESSYSTLGKALQSRSENSVIQEASKILSKDPKDLKALNALVVVYIQNHKLDMAKLILARAIKAHPNNASLACNFGIVNLIEDKIPEAIVEFQRALNSDKGHGEASYHLGALHVRYKNHAAALPLLQTAYSSLPKNKVGPHYAEALRLAGKTSAAQGVYEDLKAESSRDASLVLNYASLLVEGLKDKKRGLKMIDRVRLLTEDAAILKRADDLGSKAQTLQ